MAIEVPRFQLLTLVLKMRCVASLYRCGHVARTVQTAATEPLRSFSVRLAVLASVGMQPMHLGAVSRLWRGLWPYLHKCCGKSELGA